MKSMSTKVSVLTLLMALGCGAGREESVLISNYAKLISENLATKRILTDCTASSTSCTPTGFAGQVYAASAMIGEKSLNGLGEGAYAMTFLAASEEIINRPDLGKGGALTFDLAAPTTFSGKISIPTETAMPSQPYMSRVELAFDYIDTKFTLPDSVHDDADGSWIVRTIFVNSATISGMDVTGGDLLISGDDGATWEWCSASGCTSARPDSPYQLATAVAALAQAATADGNQNYAYYSVEFSTGLDTTYAEISDATRLWTLDFNITDAITWTQAPDTFDSKADILENFVLRYACNYNGCPSTAGISATLTIGAAGSATATP